MKKRFKHMLSLPSLKAYVLIVFLLTACSPIFRYKVESFFFDGVPNPLQQVSVKNADSLSKTDTLHNTTLANRNAGTDFFYHLPYKDKKCESCHPAYGGQSIKPIPELCYTCHENMGNRFKVLHGPVASGYCLNCHNQHVAKYPKLLIRTGQDLCLFCHNKKQVFQNKIHETVGERSCTDCHNPHGGENRGMLKSGACYNCHDDFSSKYKYLHGPVAAGYCTQCHGSHDSKTDKLLLREGQQTCFYCHDEKQVLKNEAHKDIKKTACTNCHNPHGGENRFILK